MTKPRFPYALRFLLSLMIPLGFASGAAAQTGSISGTVTDAGSGAGIGSVIVQVYTSSGSFYNSGVTSGTGAYTVTSLPAGSYFARTFVPGGVNYVDQLYQGQTCSPSCTITGGTAIAVTAGATTTGVNFALAPGGTVGGTITDASNSAPIGGVTVDIYNSAGSYVRSASSAVSWVTNTTSPDTPPNRAFVPNPSTTSDTSLVSPPVALPAGASTLAFRHFYNTESGFDGGNLEVAIGAGAFQDIVTAGGSFVAGGYNGTTSGGRPAWTGNSGGYVTTTVTMPPATAGQTVRVRWRMKTDNSVGAVGWAVDSISLTGPSGPIAAENFDSLTPPALPAGWTTEPLGTGTYSITGLAPGTYYARTTVPSSLNYLDQLYQNLPCTPSCTLTSGTPIVVASGATSAADFALTPGGSVTGSVTAAGSGTGLSTVLVQLYTSTGAFSRFTYTDSSGAYTFAGLAGGTYYARTFVSSSLNYLDQLYQNIQCSPSCTVTSGTPIVVLSGVTAVANFALPAGGTVSGTVTAATGGAALSSVSVQLYTSSGSFFKSASTNSSGAYSITGVPTGSYYAKTSVSSVSTYLDQLYQNMACSPSCTVTAGTAITVTGGAETAGVNFALPTGGTISGTVTEAGSGTALGSVLVQVYTSTGGSYKSASTNSSGIYTITGVPTGTFYARTFVSSSQNYLDQLYQNLPCGSSCTVTAGTAITATAGADTTGVNFALTPGGTMSGTVTEAGTGTPLNAVQVQIYTSTGSSFRSGSTNSAGQFTITGLPPGTYYARTFVSSSLNYLDQLYQNMPCSPTCTVTAGTAIAVATGGTTAGVNFALGPGGTVTGTVTDAGSGAGIASVTVQLYSRSGSFVRSATTNSAGEYAIAGLWAGSFFARTSVSSSVNYVDQLYQNLPCGTGCSVTLGTPIPVATGATTAGINFALQTGGSIAGTVTDALSGAGVSGVLIQVHTAAGASFRSATTNGSGGYTVAGLPTGKYYARTFVPGGANYIDQMYQNLACAPSCTVTTGSAISVAAGATTGGVNFPLAPGGTIAGTVTDAGSGAGLAGVTVEVYSSTGTFFGSGSTSGSGAYSISRLPAGSYYARTVVPGSLNNGDVLYPNLPCTGGCTVTAGTAIPVTTGGTTSNVNFALGGGGTVTGTVTDAASGAGVSGVTVQLYSSAGAFVRSVSTASSGAYAFTGLPAGTYFARTSVSTAFNYVDRLYQNLPCLGGCEVVAGTPIPVTLGGTTSGVNFALTPGGTVAGTVTDAGSGAGLNNASVQIYSSTGSFLRSASTNSSGVYTVPGLPPGTYFARAFSPFGSPYLDQLYQSVACMPGCTTTAGTPITVTQGATTSGIDFPMASGGAMTGTVTDAASGAPLSSVSVQVYNASGSAVRSASTDSAGAYTITGLPAGRYYARTFVPTALNNQDQGYQGLPCFPSCTPAAGTAITVANGATTSGVNFALAPGGTLIGRVTDASTGGGLGSVTIDLYSATGALLRSTFTAGSGDYSFTGLPAGSYYARTLVPSAMSYLGQLYMARPCAPSCTVSAGTPVAVTVGGTTSGVDFALAPSGAIAGTVTDAATGAGLSSVTVNVYSPAGSFLKSTTTNSSGRYTLVGLAAGSYFAGVAAPGSANYIDQFYQNIACVPSCTVTSSTPIPVAGGTTTGSVNFALSPGGKITGTVTDAGTGAGLSGVSVQIHTASGLIDTATTNAAGVYTVIGLFPGTYYARTSTSSFANYGDLLYPNLPCTPSCIASAGAPIVVGAGATVSGVNFALTGAGAVGGTVTDAASGAGLGGITVQIYTSAGATVRATTTNSTGGYTIVGLPPGTYRARVFVPAGLNFLDQLYQAMPCAPSCTVTAGTAIAVTAGATTGGVNFALQAGGTITGTVTDAANGAAVAGVTVQVYTSTGASFRNTSTNGTGGYTITGLPPGTYYIRTIVPSTGQYVDQLYQGMPCPSTCTVTTGTPIAIVPGGTVNGVNFALQTGGAVSGAVTDAGSGAGLAGVTVQIHTQTGAALRTTTTNGIGGYSFVGLPAGTYYVRSVVISTSPYLDRLYQDVPCPFTGCTATSGTPVPVTAGATTSGVNLALPPAGTIAGTVTDAGSGAGLNGVGVTVYSLTGSSLRSTTTNAAGAYSITGLPAGSYYARTSVPGALNNVDQLYQGVACAPSCTITAGNPIVVTAGATTTANFPLAASGSVTGTVTDAGSGPGVNGVAGVGGVTVQLYTSAGTTFKSAITNGAGVYAIMGVPAGSYYARTFVPSTLTFGDQLYQNMPCAPTCTVTTGSPILVTGGGTTSGVNFALTPGGTIGGTVTDAATGAGINGVTVQIYSSAGTQVRSATTNGAGVYSVTGLGTGSYYARTSGALSTNHLDQLYQNLLCAPTCTVTSGTPIAVTAGATTSGVNFPLPVGGTVTGTVTDSATGAVLPNVSVQVYSSVGDLVRSASTDSSGVYSIVGLATGSYYARTSVAGAANNLDQLYQGMPCAPTCVVTTGTAIPVTGGATTGGVNFALTNGAAMTGTVTDAGSLAPLASVTLSIFNSAGTLARNVSTNSSGVYSAIGLAPGTYYARAAAPGANYRAQLYQNLDCGWACPATDGTAIALTAGATTSGVDFAMRAGGTISGSVTDAASGVGLSGITVQLATSVDGSIVSVVSSTGTSSSGLYTFTGLPPGTYYARTSVSTSVNYIDQLYQGVLCPAGGCAFDAGTAIAVAAGASIGGVNFPLTPGGSVTGMVTDAETNTGIASATVQIYTATGALYRSVNTDSSGIYTFTGLPAGTYYARTSVSGTLNYLNQLYQNQPCPVTCTVTGGTPITVVPGVRTAGVDFALPAAGTVTGTVTDAGTGAALASVSVQIYSLTGAALRSGTTSSAGVYTITGLAPGSYYLRTFVPTALNHYENQVYRNLPCGTVCTVTTGTAVAVAQGAVTGGVDFVLTQGGTLTGTVVDAGTGLGIAGVSVGLYGPDGTFFRSAFTAAAWATNSSVPDTAPNRALVVDPPASSDSTLISPAIAVPGGSSLLTFRHVFNTEACCDGGSLDIAIGAGAFQDILAAGGSFAAGGYTRSISRGQVWAGDSAGYMTTTVNLPPGAAGQNIRLRWRMTSDTGVGGPGWAVDSISLTGPSGLVFSENFDGVAAPALPAGWTSSPTVAGAYSIVGIPAGTYYARTTVPSGLNYMDRLFWNLSCGPGCPVTSGTPIVVAAGATTSGIDFSLSSGGTISGMVTDAGSGAGLVGVTVQVYTPGGVLVESATTDASGAWSAGGLPTGTYYARATTGQNFISHLYPNVPCAPTCATTTGTAIAVTEGATTGGINFALPAGGAVSGTVSDATTGGRIAGVPVQVYSSAGTIVRTGNTNSQGLYVASGLPAGTYYVRTLVSPGVNYVDQVYQNMPCVAGCVATSGTPVTVTEGVTTENVDFHLTPGGAITGMVTDAETGIGLGSLSVSAYTAAGVPLKLGITNSTGVFTIAGLPGGSYFVRTAVGTSVNWVDQVYSLVPCVPNCTVTAGTPVAVAVGATTGGVNFSLTAGGTVTGKVTDAATGAGLSSVSVEIYSSAGVLYKAGTSLSSRLGAYTIAGLPAGTYYARTVVPPQLTYSDQLYQNLSCVPGCTPTSGTPIAVVVGATTGDVDFALSTGGGNAPTFTDVPLAPGATRIRAVHITELRNAINTLRSRYGLVSYAWTDAVLTARVTSVRAVHVMELRIALGEAYAAAGRTPPVYTTPVLTPGATVIATLHISELRAAVLALW